LATAVFLVDEQLAIRYANPAAENLFELSTKNLYGMTLEQVLAGAETLAATARQALADDASFVEHELSVAPTGRLSLQLSCTLTPVQAAGACVLLEFRKITQQLRIAREERILHEHQLNRELIRNLAHEIRNPLGGIRGAAQLLERELKRRDLMEYTQVIRHEADRLQALLDRLLTPNRIAPVSAVNVHEVLERVCSVILAEYPENLQVARDYDTSLPELMGDKERLIQAVLNVVRNAAQALEGRGEIRLSTRAARQFTLAKRRYRLAVLIQIVDNGPGVAPELQDKLFYPLVSGREGGTGLGLALAQTYINQHHGIIEFDSAPGHTCFSLLLPVTDSELKDG
jgi:two-component system nitrogen regulation sensor histidine kinase GlnL